MHAKDIDRDVVPGFERSWHQAQQCRHEVRRVARHIEAVRIIGPNPAVVTTFKEDRRTSDRQAAQPRGHRMASLVISDTRIEGEAAGSGTSSAGRSWLPGETANTGCPRADGRDAIGFEL